MRGWVWRALGGLALMLATGVVAAPTPVTPPPQPLPADDPGLLFWPQARRDAGFRAMERQYPVRRVAHGARAHPLPAGRPLPALAWSLKGQPQTLEGYMAAEHVSGVMVLQDGRVRLERYGLDYGPQGRWTSFSVAKSFTSTLVGAAVKDGAIRSIEDPITNYLPELKGSGYDGVTIRQVLTMTSGVKWTEDYFNPKSDVVLSGTVSAPAGQDPTLYYLSKLPREAPPGTKWLYKTGETNLIGVLVTRATGKTLADYLAEKVWKPYGMEADAVWMVASNGQEFGGFGMNARLHDYARMGQFILEGGHGVLPAGWLKEATHKQADIGQPGQGYGFQWWTHDDGTFDARGIYGQLIHIDSARKLVVVINGDWVTPIGPDRSAARTAFVDAIVAASDVRG